MTAAADVAAIDSHGRVIRTVLFIDLFESVRLMEADEDDTVARWRSLVHAIEREVLPAHEGRLVKSMGDGLLLEFPRTPPAVAAGFAIQERCALANAGVPAERHMLLRIGVHVGPLIADVHDVYGQSVNLAARLTQLAGPGEFVVSAAVRDQLIPFLDADVEDLGECYVKHLAQPIRAYRLGPPSPWPVIAPHAFVADLRPAVAVVPFRFRGSQAEHRLLGDILADEIISTLSLTSELNVISRLSTTAFRDRNATLDEVSLQLHANYVLSGAYWVNGRHVVLTAELANAKTGHVVWSDSLTAKAASILTGDDQLIDTVVAQTSHAVIAAELQRAQSRALPTLESYTLLLGAIALMHRLSPSDFERAREMLQTLIGRAPRQAVPHAWLAKWHVLRVQQGWSSDAKKERVLALDCTKRALDCDAQCSLALTIDGFVHTNLLKQLDIASERYERALAINPNESLAWLLKGTMHAFRGEGTEAMLGARHARRLSPLDPLRYFYDSLSATAALSAERYEEAIALALRSMRLNRTHTSTFRALAISQWQLGRLDEARRTVAELMRLEPEFTVTKYLERSPSSGFPTGAIWSNALREAGVPP